MTREEQLQRARSMVKGLKQQYQGSGQPAQAAQPQQRSVGGFFDNTLRSAGRFVRDTASGIANIFNPNPERNTLVNVGRVAAGAAEKVVPGRQAHEGSFEAILDFYKQRYGSTDKLVETIYTDPVGFLADLSAVAGGAGTVTRLAKMGKTANTLNRVSRATDPLRAATATGRGVARVAEETFGATTGAGAAAVRESFEAGRQGGARQQAFRSNLTSPGTGEELLVRANSALDDLFEQRRQTYQANLQKLEEGAYTTKNGQLYVRKVLTGKDAQIKGYTPGTEVLVPTNLTTKGVKDIATRSFKEIGVDAKGGQIDFSKRPSLDSGNLQKLSGLVYDWEDLTPTGLNQLRQEVEGFRKGGLNLSPADNRFNHVVDRISEGLSKYLEDRVPQVKPLNEEYARQTAFIQEIRRELSLGDGKSIDTGIRKLTSTMRQNNEFRKALIEQLQTRAGTNITSEIAGHAMSPGLPRGLMRQVLAGGMVLGSFSVMTIFQSLPFLLAASPRVVAEFLNALGTVARHADKAGIPKAAGAASRAGFQVERTGINNPESDQ